MSKYWRIAANRNEKIHAHCDALHLFRTLKKVMDGLSSARNLVVTTHILAVAMETRETDAFMRCGGDSTNIPSMDIVFALLEDTGGGTNRAELVQKCQEIIASIPNMRHDTWGCWQFLSVDESEFALWQQRVQ